MAILFEVRVGAAELCQFSRLPTLFSLWHPKGTPESSPQRHMAQNITTSYL